MMVITLILSCLFVFASSIKITGWQQYIFETQLKFFHKYGLTRLHMFLIGIIEFTSALLLLSSIFMDNILLNGLGALGIAFTSIGAIYFHLKFDTVKDAIAAIVTLSLSATLLISNQMLVKMFV